ncbi:MAG: hypothetical protein LKE46_08445 [Clostridium sp.]|jgi:hypothetical protein|uniref:hypothetical protein n=1 Tax=Clostridium sp. TaxID=1506 RepID=UPI0025C6F851|nr:hypothetical protein [Clostridium sp.]MCH3964294.1 hypothetical protein [Clostridium sp.]MCI1715470.1 hypothetical protein [Clostridium sp.]MCI1799739.1 hypothetical protein [Clostridium sp.]MCI1813654.1 hypothetical protein [Clostridium sp.]MCI1870552.1 hypothetical protein [Clostridium sp.]
MAESKSKDILEVKRKNSNYNSLEYIDIIKMLIKSKKEYEITKEQETTKRMAIKSDLFKYLKKLDAKKEVLLEVFEKEYNFRKNTVDKMFDVVERALDDGRDTVVCQALDSIEGIVKESPLKGIAQVSRAFENDDEDLLI